VLVDLGKALQLCVRHFNRFFQHEPVDLFAAWRSGQGTGEVVIALRSWQQLADIDADACHFLRLAFLLRQGIPQGLHQRILRAFAEQHRYHGQLAFRVFVHQVRHHRIAAAIDLFFARLVEVELQQVVALAVDRDAAAWGVVHLDGMAVVENLQRRRAVSEFQRRQLRLAGLADVDWRLVVAQLAGAEVLFQLAPVLRAVGAFIAPVRRRVFGEGRGRQQGGAEQEGEGAFH